VNLIVTTGHRLHFLVSVQQSNARIRKRLTYGRCGHVCLSFSVIEPSIFSRSLCTREGESERILFVVFILPTFFL